MHFVRMKMQRVRHQVLHFGRVLRRAVHVHRAALFRNGVADLSFQVELLLAADVERGLELVRCAIDGAACATVVRFADDVYRRHDVLAPGVRVLRREHGRHCLDDQRVFGTRCGTARRIARFGDDREYRLADVADVAP